MKPSKAVRRQIKLRKRAVRKLPHFKTKHRFVDHPRYGNQPIFSSENYSMGEVRSAFWQYSHSSNFKMMIFPQTAIRANVARQNYGCSPRSLYVDIARPCRNCSRWFIFYALEQKYWFETLGFFVDADCVDCQDCRHLEHDFKGGIDRYSALLAKDKKSIAEWHELSDLGDFLFTEGYIKKPETLLKSRVPKSLRKVS